MYLSKSRYTRAVQCPKMLWMDLYKKNEAYEDPSLQEIYERGTDVGSLARGYFGEYSLVEETSNKQQMMDDTQRYIEAGAVNIAEASFSFNGLFCSVDILHKTPSGWEIYEVKSSTYVKTIHYDDMAYQCYVLTNCGLNITGVYLMHLNGKYVRRGDLDLHQLFNPEDCTEKINAKLPFVGQNIQQIEQFFARTDDFEPEYDIGEHCENPYKCAYRKYCRRNLPSPNVFDIKCYFKYKKKCRLYKNGIISFEDVLAHQAELNEHQLLQVETEVFNKPPTVDKDKIKGFLDDLTYPLYHLDFETFMQGVPEYNGISPYMQIPFQYSLHIQHEKCGECEHREHLGKEGTDTRRALAEQLCRDIPINVCSLAYNSSFEKRVIKALANEYPDLAEHLMNIHDNIQDLAIPFKDFYYYQKEFFGRYTIKLVLPAMCPNDPELDYHNLEQIQNGTDASTTFAKLHTKTPEEIERTRQNLLKYCGLDTLAMVKILEKLYKICE